MTEKFNPQEYTVPMRPMGDDPGAIKDYRDALLGPPRPMLDLDAIRARRAAITCPPWQIHDIDPTWVADAQNRVLIADDEEGHILREPDAAFIAAAPADIDALLARVADLEAEVTRLQAYERVVQQAIEFAKAAPNNLP